MIELKAYDVFSYPRFIDEAARIIGRLRMEKNTELRAKNPRYDCGPWNEKIDIIGITGEMAFSHYLQAQGIDHELSKLLDENPVINRDVKFRLNGITIAGDIKTTHNHEYLHLKQYKHEKKKHKITHYIFVVLADFGRASYFMFEKMQIESWVLYTEQGRDPEYRIYFQQIINET